MPEYMYNNYIHSNRNTDNLALCIINEGITESNTLLHPILYLAINTYATEFIHE